MCTDPPTTAADNPTGPSGPGPRPQAIDVQKDEGIAITWRDGMVSKLTVPLLRRMSPSADARALREEMATNPLTVLPASAGSAQAGTSGRLRIADVEMVGNYAIRLTFSDGHATGLYSWRYLRELAEAASAEGGSRPATE